MQCGQFCHFHLPLSVQDNLPQMRLVGSCKHNSEPSAFTQGQKFLDELSVCQLFRKDFVLWWDVQGSEYKNCRLLEREAMWFNISMPKNTAIFVCLFVYELGWQSLQVSFTYHNLCLQEVSMLLSMKRNIM